MLINGNMKSAVDINILKDNTCPSVGDPKLTPTWVLKQDYDQKLTSTLIE